jgi:hypothetical protein
VALLSGCNSDEPDDTTPFSVKGVVTSDTGTPLEAVSVSSIIDSTLTDAKGEYTVTAYPYGSLEFTKTGYVKRIESIEGKRTIDVSLTKQTGDQATRFTVKTANRTCSNGAYVTITTVEISDFGQGTGTATFTKNKVWVLKNRVFVLDGQTLTIEAGTIVKASAGKGETAGALIVARGGKLIAKGTASQPIIFTSEKDSLLNDPAGNPCFSTNLTAADRGLWGGILLLGKAAIGTDSGEARAQGTLLTEPASMYGGNHNADTSGVLQYVSIRHGGAALDIDNQMNGLTLAGVGSGTRVDHVEVFANQFDGIRFFGGTVNTRYLVSAWCGNDAFEYSQGWRGSNQYWLALQDDQSEKGCNGLGGNGSLLSQPLIVNATFNGPGNLSGRKAASFQNNAAGQFLNCIMMHYAVGADIQYAGQNKQDSYQRLAANELLLRHNIFYGITFDPWFRLDNQSGLSDNHPDVQAAREFVKNAFGGNENYYEEPGLSNLVPAPGSPAATLGTALQHPFIDSTEYSGCFAPSQPKWTKGGWSRTEQ